MNQTFVLEVKYMVGLLRSAAKNEILPRWGKVTVSEKGQIKKFRDIVTEADIEASKFILDDIRKKFPGSYSEEHKYDDRFENDMLWQIDPVDGTDEFINQIVDGYACHAALLQKQSDGTYYPVAGIIYLPGVDKLWAYDGKDVIFLNKGFPVTIPILSNNKLVGWIRKVDPNKQLADFYNHLGKKLGLPVDIDYGGGSGASIASLLEGKTNLIIMNYDYTKEWDLAMAEPIIKARGGFICDLDGNSFEYNRKYSEGHKEPYNLKGYVISIAFKKNEILHHIPKNLLIKRLD